METIGKNNLAGAVIDASYTKIIEMLDEKLSQGFKPLSINEIIIDENKAFCASFYKEECTLNTENHKEKKDNEAGPGEFEDLFNTPEFAKEDKKEEPIEEKNKKDKHVNTVVGKCPVCGGEMQMNEKGFIKCQNSSCGAMFSRYYGRSLTVGEATSLFNGQEVELDNLEYNGKTFTQKVSVSNTKDDNNWIKLKKCS